MSKKNKCIVLCQLYHIDRLNDILHLCKKLKLPLFLSIGERYKKDKILLKLLRQNSEIIYKHQFHPNYGVDIAPFLKQLKEIDQKQFPFFIKIHSKQSYWGVKNHVDWGSVLIDSLIGDQDSLNRSMKILSKSHVGMIAPKSFHIQDQEGHNTDKIHEILKLLGYEFNNRKYHKFVAGTMFISKTGIFHKILNKKYNAIDNLLQKELGKIDDLYYLNGTYSHSMERVLGYAVCHQRKSIHASPVQSIKIYNSQYRRIHLRIMYNQYCYILEDVNIFGKVKRNSEKFIEIEWLHLPGKPIVRYYYMYNNKTLSISRSSIK